LLNEQHAKAQVIQARLKTYIEQATLQQAELLEKENILRAIHETDFFAELQEQTEQEVNASRSAETDHKVKRKGKASKKLGFAN